MLLDYNEEEKKELEAINKKYNIQKAHLKLQKAFDEWENFMLNKKSITNKGINTTEEEIYLISTLEKTQEEYSVLRKLNDDESEKIYKKAEARELEYFSHHVQELCHELKNGINDFIADIRDISNFMPLRKENYQDDKKLSNVIYNIFRSYLEIILKDNYDKYVDIIGFIGQAIKNKENIPSKIKRSPKEKNESLPAHKTNEIKLETSKIGGLIVSRSKNSHFYNEEEVEIQTGTFRKKDVITFVSLKIEDLNKEEVYIPGIDRLTPFDGDVLCASISLYEAGNTYMTTEMIYRTMAGNKKLELTPQMKEEIFKSLRKLRLTGIYINAEQEKAVGYNTSVRYEGVLLPNEIIVNKTVFLNGKEVKDCIRLLNNSPLYEYAEGKNQISRVPTAMLNVPLSNTKETIELKGYLLRRIANMKNIKSKLGNVIRYESIFEYLQIYVETEGDSLKLKKARIRQDVRKILEFWKQEGHIKDFKEIKEGREITKIEIDF